MSESYSSFSKEWRDNAACKNFCTDNFFPVAVTKSNLDSIRSVYSVCRNCPVITHCLYEAFLYDYDGIWGHTTYKQRKAFVKYFFNNNLENFTFDQCQSIVDEILAAKIQPNSTYKKTVKLAVNSKTNNSVYNAGETNV